MKRSQEMDKKAYYLGLDIGTNSVGFCVTDRDYHIITKKAVRTNLQGKRYYTRKHLWGARLFDEASTASKRRSYRTTRRRYQRRKWRLFLLREIFTPEMEKVDETFFNRLDCSFFHKEDKPANIREYGIPYPDKKSNAEFYRTYPTIYHLRLALLENPEKKFDIREIFLAFSHMVKYRGNFLTEGDIHTGEGGTSAKKLKELFDELDNTLKESQGDDNLESLSFNITNEQSEKLFSLFQTENGKSDLKEKEREIFSFDKKDLRFTLIELIDGTPKKLGNLIEEAKDDEELKQGKIDFNAEDFEASLAPFQSFLDEHQFTDVLLAAKSIYDFRILTFLLKDKGTICEAMVSLYNEHHEDLGNLRNLIRKYAPEKYADFFKRSKNPEDALLKNYVNYVGYNRFNNGKQEKALHHTTSKEELYKAILEILPKDLAVSEEDRSSLEEIHDRIEKGLFLPRQNTKDNSVFPYQLTLDEMRRIIDNQKQYYPFLAEEAPDFRNPEKECEKILSLISFRVPYYVGPLSTDKNKDGKEYPHHWAVRKEENVKITPWNFFDVIDTAASGNKFIEKMKNACSYLFDAPTLPKSSLLYSLYTLLNEMNNWMINGKPISKEDKKLLIEKVYLVKRKPKKNDLIEALAKNHNTTNKEEVRIETRTSKDLDEKDIHANLSSWIDMLRIFGRDFLNDKELREKIETAIKFLTVFKGKAEKQKKIVELGFDKEQNRKLLSLKYKGWGKLSQKLLDGMTTPIVNSETGEEQEWTVIDIMKEEPLNLMEILSEKSHFTFAKQISDHFKQKKLSEEELIEKEYVSPGMKRALLQTVKVVKELKKILNIDSFDSYFVECTREKGKKGVRTKSRKKQIDDLYKATKVTDKELKKQLADQNEESLRNDKLFLYFLQRGKSVYTGKPIDLDSFGNYDIDHIIPQAKLKDDSLDNRVLVEKNINIDKKDAYPIPNRIITPEGREHIEFLFHCDEKHRFLSEEKYRRLTRPETDLLTDEERAGFVNRQLVMTNQAVKAVADVLKEIDPNAKVVYSKASNVSGFRKLFDLTKSRDVNDFHHAHDAYLNIVVGNVYNKVFSSSFDVDLLRKVHEYYESMKIDPENFFKKDKYIPNTPIRVWEAKNYTKESHYTEEDPSSTGTIDLIRANLLLNDPMVTKMVSTQSGGLFDDSIRSSQKNSSLPIKAYEPLSSPGYKSKYGGYEKLTIPYYMVVRSDGDKGKHIYSLEGIPAAFQHRLIEKDFAQNYLSEKLELKNPEILLPIVKINTIVQFINNNGNASARVTINGKSENYLIASIASPLWLPLEYVRYVKAISILLGTNLPAGQKKPNLDNVPDDDQDILVGKTALSKESNQKFFDYLCDDVFKRPCFALIPGLAGALVHVIASRNVFSTLSTKKQIIVLQQIIQVLQNKNSKADFSLLQLKDVALIRFNKILNPHTRIIAQSVTGFYEKILFTVPED